LIIISIDVLDASTDLPLISVGMRTSMLW